jgi:signal transduction histidine kinase
VELCAFRVVQEALTNVLKHAGRVQTTVTIDYGADQLRLRVEDAGAGLRMEPVVGHGLVGMRERVALYGGRLAHGQGVAGGFVVEAHLPCPSTVPEGP